MSTARDRYAIKGSESRYEDRMCRQKDGAASPAPVAETGKQITFTYRNWRGEVAERTVLPKCIWWGKTEWHPEFQWLMTATDIAKGEDRDFALKDIQFAPAASKPKVKAGRRVR